jgi:hypothetical protein
MLAKERIVKRWPCLIFGPVCLLAGCVAAPAAPAPPAPIDAAAPAKTETATFALG